MSNESYKGQKAVFTGKPSIVTGGFTLEYEKQKFIPGDTISAGTLAVFNEQSRRVSIIKTARVNEVDSNDPKIITLSNGYLYQPLFVEGESVLNTVTGAFADAPIITNIKDRDTLMTITLSAPIEGLKEDDILIQVIDNNGNADYIGAPNGVVYKEIEVKERYTGIDVTADTREYELFVRRIPPIPDNLKDSTGTILKTNPHIKFTKIY